MAALGSKQNFERTHPDHHDRNMDGTTPPTSGPKKRRYVQATLTFRVSRMPELLSPWTGPVR